MPVFEQRLVVHVARRVETFLTSKAGAGYDKVALGPRWAQKKRIADQSRKLEQFRGVF